MQQNNNSNNEMDEPKDKSRFWGLFRTRSSATATADGKLEKVGGRRVSEGDVVGLGARILNRRGSAAAPPPGLVLSGRRRPRRPDPTAAKGKGRQMPNGSGVFEPDLGALTEWPPSGMSTEKELGLGDAMGLIARGVPAFKGHKRPIPHASDHYYALFATAAGNRGDETDGANQHDSMIQLMSLKIQGSSGPPVYPWETLEQPSLAFCFGRRPGTVTLNHWVSLASVLPPPIALRDPGIQPREVELDRILGRLKELERGLEDDDEDLMYRNLYRRFLRDPDKLRSPHRTLDRQITDLIMVLSRSDWIDFTAPKNQVVTRFVYDTSAAQHATHLKFFHQLLFAVELEARINSKHHLPEAKEKLLLQLPPTIQWDLALARRWRDNLRIEAYGKNATELRLRSKLKKRQIKMLKRFTQMMKWPNLAATLNKLKQRDADGDLNVSSHAMAFFAGLVLPGPTFPFFIMNTLVDIDPDDATDELALLTHMHPHCGFQYRNSYTYWTAESIVGKVLAPTCRSVAGWVGPARPTVDLGRSQIARIRSRKPRQQPTPEDVRTMYERSDPLGPPAQVYPVKEYELVAPEDDEAGGGGRLSGGGGGDRDQVRTELLSLRPCADRAGETGPRWFDAALQFAIDGVSWPLRLAFDVCFVSAWPCSDGPHPLFVDYDFTSVRADELVGIRSWNGMYSSSAQNHHHQHHFQHQHQHQNSARSSPVVVINSGAAGPSSSAWPKPPPPGSGNANGNGNGNGSSNKAGPATPVTPGVVVSPPTPGSSNNNNGAAAADDDDEKVLVVEAFGVSDNEVLARAWCAHLGLSAVVADVNTTCMACAIREAYAATLTVVILVDDDQDVDRDD